MVFARKRRLSLFLLFFSALVLLHAPHVACADDDVDVDDDEDDGLVGDLGLDGDGDGEEGDEEDFDEVEEIEISSPQQVQKYWIAAIHDHLKKNKSLDLQPGGDMHKRGEKEARKRLRVRDKKSKRSLANALLAGGDVVRALPAASGNASAAWSNASGMQMSAPLEAEASAGGAGAVALTAMFNESLKLYSNISKGALANVGALKVNESARKEKPDLSPLDVVWNVVSELMEENATHGSIGDRGELSAEERKKRGLGGHRKRRREPFPRAVDTEMAEWFEEKGGRVEGLEMGTDRSSGRPALIVQEPADGAGGSGVGADRGADDLDPDAIDLDPDAAGDDAGDAAEAGAILPGTAVLTVPIRATLSQLSARNVKTATGYLGDRRHLKDAFKHNQQWALALMLLTQYYKNGQGDGEDSKWRPYLRTLRLASLTRAVTNELAGTYAAELMRTWEDEAELALTWLDENICKKHSREICQRDPKRGGSLPFSREDMKWSLGVVRSYAFNVTKRTTGKTFLALFPYSNLIHHRHGAGGNCTLELDNSIRVYAGSVQAPGARFEFDRGPLTDAETLLTYRFVSTGENVDNAVRLRLPGTQRSHPDMPLWWQTDILRDWRKALLLPPRTADLWRSAHQLQLWGDDEDEEKATQQLNSQLAQLGGDQHTPEEVLMLTGAAPDAESAALMVRGGAEQDARPQLYAVADPEDDEKAAEETTKLADQAQQLQMAFAADHRDPSVLKVINQTKHFFLHGTKPHAALDDVDTILLRKMVLLEKCGNHSSHKLRYTATAAGDDNPADDLLAALEAAGGEDEDEDADSGTSGGAGAGTGAGDADAESGLLMRPADFGELDYALSPQLLCAVRVHVMNESEIELFCNRNLTKGPWTEVNCAEDTDKDGLNWTLPVSYENENKTVSALRSSIAALLADYPTHDDDDEPLLGMVGVPPITQAIVRLRLRERRLLRTALSALEQRQRLNERGHLPYQITGRAAKHAELRRRIAEREARGAALREQLLRPRPVVSVPVDLPGGAKANMTVLEGQSLEAVVRQFVVEHGLAENALGVLQAEARKRTVSPPPPVLMHPVVVNGSRYILKVAPGQNATAEAEDFCVMHGVPMEEQPGVVEEATEQAERRAARDVVLTVPIDAPDGRKLQLEIREGEQHEVGYAVQIFAEAMRLGAIDINMLANVVLQRLPAPIMTLPVQMGGQRQLQLRVAPGANVTRVVSAFAEVHALDDAMQLRIQHAVVAGMNPGAYIVPLSI